MWIATTKIWAVKDSLKRVVDYASYPEKTEYSGLANALHYAENGVKTELCETVHLVSGLHCRPEQAWDDMRSIQEHFGKTGGTVALHISSAETDRELAGDTGTMARHRPAVP